MSSSASVPFFYLLSFALLLQAQTILGDDPLYYICSKAGKPFPKNGTYDTNLKKVLDNLSMNAPKTGFANSSAGGGKDNVAFGLALCRGDTNFTDCKNCIADARTELHNQCGNNRSAIVWYDYCLLKYSDKSFFGMVDEKNRVYLINVFNLTNSTSFVNTTLDFLSGLSQRAVKSEKLYYAGEAELCEFLTLYGLVQCSRDLTTENCTKCLDDAIADLPKYSANRQGGRTLYASCNVRYEIYPFVKDD
ncbi:cysteine-rich repeat secretory protein 38-like [Malania oleifera]|uniref:cysteine-rich repeat secretory protein 38-like n=1 Tax=Malania oleifera TaxID=397392 RepID=UPI0025ADA23E|nr:cysteine-rich repeat secretory protein 38-like [Malania oleifera]